MSGYRNQAVVALGFSFLGLLRLHHSEETGRNHASSECGLVHDHDDEHDDENVFRIAIRGPGARHKAESMGEDHALGKYARQSIKPERFLVLELVAASTGRLDHSIYGARMPAIDWIQSGWVGVFVLLGSGHGSRFRSLEGGRWKTVVNNLSAIFRSALD